MNQSMLRNLLVAFLLFLFTTHADLTLEEYEELERQTPELVFETRTAQDETQYTPKIPKLIFLTPWNAAGGDLVIKYAKKFDYVSPCWYDLSFNEDHIIIENDRLYNDTFVRKLREANPDVKIVPRIYVSSQQTALLHSIGSFESKFKQAIGLIVTIVERADFNGLVWDTPFNTMIAGEKHLSIRNLIVQLVNSIRMNLNRKHDLLFNMANPLGRDLANDMYSILNVNAILIQNYDNDRYIDSIQASLNWVRNLKRNTKTSFFLLLPFFSRRQGQGIDSKEIKRMVENEENIGSRIENQMCTFFQYKKRIQSFTPCYAYFKYAFKRIESEELSVGFWEAGNGLENYFQFL